MSWAGPALRKGELKKLQVHQGRLGTAGDFAKGALSKQKLKERVGLPAERGREESPSRGVNERSCKYKGSWGVGERSSQFPGENPCLRSFHHYWVLPVPREEIQVPHTQMRKPEKIQSRN